MCCIWSPQILEYLTILIYNILVHRCFIILCFALLCRLWFSLLSLWPKSYFQPITANLVWFHDRRPNFCINTVRNQLAGQFSWLCWPKLLTFWVLTVHARNPHQSYLNYTHAIAQSKYSSALNDLNCTFIYSTCCEIMKVRMLVDSICNWRSLRLM